MQYGACYLPLQNGGLPPEGKGPRQGALTGKKALNYKGHACGSANVAANPCALPPTTTHEVSMMMKINRPIIKPVSYLLVFVFSFFSVLWAPAQAALVQTGQVLPMSDAEQTRARLQVMLERADVRAQLEAWGVDPQAAQARVDSLTPQELAELSARMDQLPAGGSTVGTIAVVSLIVFLVLLTTDIMGYTDIFPFTR